MTLDPADQAVISQALIAAVQEMGAKLLRSAFSTVVREAQDASASILDRDGNVVVQSEMIPIQLGTMRATFLPCLERKPVEMLEPGDFYVSNDPYAGGQHLPDVYIFTPVFAGGEVIAFTATVAHHADIGGGAAGINAAAGDIFQEGLRIPPACYNLERDWSGGPFQRLLAANIRVPDETIGDFNAQFAACATGAHRLVELAGKYGRDTVRAAMDELQAYSERRVRAALADIPDGTWDGIDWLDDDGIGDEPLPIRARVTVAGEGVHVDFAGTHPQIRRPLNAPLSSTLSAAVTCLKAVLTPADIPFNDGLTRPFSFDVPEGSILNPRPPAPVRARMVTSYRVFTAIMRALAQAVPEQAIASGYDTTTALTFARLTEGRYRVCTEVLGGGYGASAKADGCDAIAGPLGNCANTPVEALDMEYDFFRLAEFALIEDACGHGRHRGGLGYRRRYEVLKDGVRFGLYADRFRVAPQGLFGGGDGIAARCRVERRDGATEDLRSKAAVELMAGDVVVMETGSGAGYGPATERPRRDVECDVEQGLISATTARRIYPPEAAE